MSKKIIEEMVTLLRGFFQLLLSAAWVDWEFLII